MSRTVNVQALDRAALGRRAAQFCAEYSRAKTEAERAGIAAKYQFVGVQIDAGTTSLVQLAQSYCSSTDAAVVDSFTYKVYVESIAPGAYDAYEKCLDMSRDGVRFNVQNAAILPKRISLSVSYVSGVRDDQYAAISVLSPADGKCMWKVSDDVRSGSDGVKLQSGTTAVLWCERTEQGKPAAIRITRTDGTNGELVLPWRAYDEHDQPIDMRARVRPKTLVGEVDIVADVKPTIRFIGALSRTTIYFDEVAFPPDAFSETPLVFLQLVGLREDRDDPGEPSEDLRDGRLPEFALTVYSVDTTGFIYKLFGPGNASLTSARMQWIAIAR